LFSCEKYGFQNFECARFPADVQWLGQVRRSLAGVWQLPGVQLLSVTPANGLRLIAYARTVALYQSVIAGKFIVQYSKMSVLNYANTHYVLVLDYSKSLTI